MTSFIKIIIAALFLLQVAGAHAQQSISINRDGALPDSKAILDVQSTTRGLLIPRLTAQQRIAMAAGLTAAQAGMQVSDSATGQLYFWTGTQFTNASILGVKSPIIIKDTLTNSIALNAGTKAGDLITWDGNNWVNKQPVQKFSISVDNMQPFLAVNYFISPYGVYPSQTDAFPFVGQVCIAAFNFAPNNFLPCDGSLLSITDYDILFTLIGTTYGGDGVSTFAIPDLRGRVPLHFGAGSGLTSYTLGDVLGSETSTIAH